MRQQITNRSARTRVRTHTEVRTSIEHMHANRIQHIHQIVAFESHFLRSDSVSVVVSNLGDVGCGSKPRRIANHGPAREPDYRIIHNTDYINSCTAKIRYSRSICSRGLIAVILYKRLQNGVFWNIHITPQQKSLYSRRLLIVILCKRLQNDVFWNMEIPPQQKFYIPEAYIPKGSLL